MKIIVACGGVSNERNISLDSGNCVFNALVEMNKNVEYLDVRHKNITQELERINADVCFNVLHGNYGEDGIFQSICESIELPYTGSDFNASAIAMNKVQSKRIFAADGLPTLPFVEWIIGHNDPQPSFDFPWCIKPSSEGSSIGIIMVMNNHQWSKVRNELLNKKGEVYLIEPLANGQELTVGIINDRAMAPIWVKPQQGFYDFQAKYQRNDTEYLFDTGLSDADLDNIKKIALQSFRVIGCHGWGRVDLIYHDDMPYILEINTVPGMTSHSLVPKAYEYEGGSFNNLVLDILKSAKLHLSLGSDLVHSLDS
ncbi:MAG TPA: D-alanine--D-alanine ligase [Gammaproteobacteria bacterium]|nr:D-alanine--D-alanine ligase [Gammaproteobacteria bacterium]